MTRTFLAAAAALLIAPTAQADDAVITTLDWPPYTSPTLPLGGVTTALVAEVFAAAGIEVDVATLPWKRAISKAHDDPGAMAYFPGYHCRHVEGFVASEPVGFGPLGFAEHVDAPVTWSDIDDLGTQQLQIGTVLGYANTSEFDEKAGTGWIKAIPAPDDVTNLRKLARQRIDVAVIDRLVLSYLLATEPSLAGLKDDLVFDERPLEDKTLFVCFVDDAAGHEMRDRFNAALARFDVDAAVEAYFEDQFQ